MKPPSASAVSGPDPVLPAHVRALSGRPVVLGLSGGRDSVALLHLLLASGFRQLILAHLNHGLRGRESGQDAAFVRRLARRTGLRCEIEREPVAQLARAGRLSLETAGRERRHAFFGRVAQRHGARHVLLAHHADDQAETVLAQLCRGAGLGGLQGMQEVSELALPQGGALLLVRPLLGVRRAAIDAYLVRHGLAFREDSSNAERLHRRNRLRHEVLPLLNDVFERDVSPLLARFAGLAGRDEAWLQREARRILEEEAALAEDGSLRLTPRLTALDPALQSRVLLGWLRDQLRLGGIGFGEVEQVRAMLVPGGPAKVNLPGGRHLRRKARRLWLEALA